MGEQTEARRLPPLPGLIAGGLVILGLFLSIFVAEGFLILAGLGAFGPGILRELGWLRDQDEFQRQAAHRAGYHAYLIGGLIAVTISAVALLGANLEGGAEWVGLILIVMWTTWLFSSLLAYWGARKTASRILTVFGSFWAVFVLAHFVGQPPWQEPGGWAGVLVGVVLLGSFFGLAWMAGRRPRLTGRLLLAVSALFSLIVIPTWAARSLNLSAILFTATLLLVPLIASGIALLRERDLDSQDGDEVG